MNAADGTPNAQPTSMVNRIVNIKPLQQEMGTMLTGHTSKQITLRPDTARAIYNPGDKITFTLNAHEADYINLEDSVVWFKIRISATQIYNVGAATLSQSYWNDQAFPHKILSNGGAGLIDRLRIYAGTTELQDYEEYGVLYGSLAAMEMVKRTPDSETLLGVSSLNYPYKGPLTSNKLNVDNFIDKAVSEEYWIKVPILSVLNDAGFIPNYQTKSRIKIIIYLSQNNAVWKNMVYLPNNKSSINDLYDAAYDRAIPYIQTYNSLSPAPNYVQTIHESNFYYELTDIVMQAHGLTVLNGGVLDDSPVEVFTESYTTMTSPTSGQVNERIPFQIKKSSINGIHAVFVDPNRKSSQGASTCPQDMWLRAGTIGAVNLEEDNRLPQLPYDPSVVWWAFELGGHRFPTDMGAGEKSPSSRDSNCPLWYHEYQRYNKRNNIMGSTFPASLTPFFEDTSPFAASDYASIASFGAGLGESGTYSRGDPEYTYYLNTMDSALNPFTITPNYFGMTETLYGGSCIRAVITGLGGPLIRYSQVSFHQTTALTGGKFIIACSLSPLDKAGSLIQGIDTERYDFNLLIQRDEAIDTNIEIPGTNGILDQQIEFPLITLKERNPEVLVFFKYDVRLIMQNGVITIETCYHFFGAGH